MVTRLCFILFIQGVWSVFGRSSVSCVIVQDALKSGWQQRKPGVPCNVCIKFAWHGYSCRIPHCIFSELMLAPNRPSLVRTNSSGTRKSYKASPRTPSPPTDATPSQARELNLTFRRCPDTSTKPDSRPPASGRDQIRLKEHIQRLTLAFGRGRAQSIPICILHTRTPSQRLTAYRVREKSETKRLLFC